MGKRGGKGRATMAGAAAAPCANPASAANPAAPSGRPNPRRSPAWTADARVLRRMAEAHESDAAMAREAYRAIMRLLGEGRLSLAAMADALAMAQAEVDDRRAEQSLTWADEGADYPDWKRQDQLADPRDAPLDGLYSGPQDEAGDGNRGHGGTRGLRLGPGGAVAGKRGRRGRRRVATPRDKSGD